MFEGNPPIEGSMPSSTDELIAPLQLGNYRLVRRLGEGGMGIVYEAVQKRPERAVALKLMRQAVMTREQLHRFERESQLLGSLVHPNIAQVYEAGTHREGSLSIPFYAMELVPQARPVTVYATEAKLTRRQRVELMIQICSAIEYAHDHAVLHRDLKPSNILMTPQGMPKVIDLGVSRLLSEASITLTRSDQLLGTIQYMSPEQVAESAGAPSVLWDVYSLGVVLYELIVGQLPYQLPTDNALRAARALESATPTRPRRVDPSISRELESVILKTLARDPTQRYASVRALTDDLNNVLAAKPVRARTAKGFALALQSTRHILRRFRWVLVVAVIIVWLFCALTLQARGLLKPVDSRWPAFALTHLQFVPDRRFEGVSVVAIRNDLEKVAAALTINDYDPTIRQSARPVFGAIVSRLAKGNPKAIALAISFAAPSRFDGQLINSLRAVEDSGIPVVVPITKWKHEGGPDTLPELVAHHRLGVPGIAEIDHATGVISMWIDEFDGDEAGFVTQVVAAANGLSRQSKIYLDLQGRVRANDAKESVLGRVSTLQGGPGKEDGIARGVAANFAQVPSDAALLASELSLEEVLAMDDAALKAAFSGRVVLIGDARPDRDIKVEVVSGREVFGYQLSAAVIDQILTDKVVHWPMQLQFIRFSINAEIALFAAAYLVLVVAGLLIRSWRILAIAIGLLFVTAAAIPVVAFKWQGILLGSPATLLLLVWITPIIFSIRRWTSRPSV